MFVSISICPTIGLSVSVFDYFLCLWLLTCLWLQVSIYLNLCLLVSWCVYVRFHVFVFHLIHTSIYPSNHRFTRLFTVSIDPWSFYLHPIHLPIYLVIFSWEKQIPLVDAHLGKPFVSAGFPSGFPRIHFYVFIYQGSSWLLLILYGCHWLSTMANLSHGLQHLDMHLQLVTKPGDRGYFTPLIRLVTMVISQGPNPQLHVQVEGDCFLQAKHQDAATFILPMTHFFSLPDYTFEELLVAVGPCTPNYGTPGESPGWFPYEIGWWS